MGLLLNVGINHPDYSLDVHYELKVSPIDRCYLQKIRFHLILLRFLRSLNEKKSYYIQVNNFQTNFSHSLLKKNIIKEQFQFKQCLKKNKNCSLVIQCVSQ